MSIVSKLAQRMSRLRRKKRLLERMEEPTLEPIDPARLVLQIGAEEHFNSGKFGFAVQHREDYWEIVKPMLIYAAALYQDLPATRYTHHTSRTGLLAHSLEVADLAVDYEMRERPRVLHSQDSRLSKLSHDEHLAVAFAFGLLHDLCNLHTNIRVDGFFGDTIVERVTYDCIATENRSRNEPDPVSLFNFLTTNRERPGRYSYEHLPYGRLTPCSHCVTGRIRYVLKAAGIELPFDILHSLEEASSLEHKSLMATVKRANDTSIDLDRQRKFSEDVEIRQEQVELAIAYCCQRTCLLDNVPVVAGRAFLSHELLREVINGLPDFDDFIHIKERGPAIVDDSWRFEINGIPYKIERDDGYWLKRKSALNLQLLKHIR